MRKERDHVRLSPTQGLVLAKMLEDPSLDVAAAGEAFNVPPGRLRRWIRDALFGEELKATRRLQEMALLHGHLAKQAGVPGVTKRRPVVPHRRARDRKPGQAPDAPPVDPPRANGAEPVEQDGAADGPGRPDGPLTDAEFDALMARVRRAGQ